MIAIQHFFLFVVYRDDTELFWFLKLILND